MVSVLPNGEPVSSIAQLGFKNEIARNAVADGGERVVWSEESAHPHLYVRDMRLGKTLQVDTPEAGCKTCGAGAVGPVFQSASSDGSRVLFTDTQRLTSNAGAAGTRDLYECEVVEEAGGPACHLADLTPPGASGGNANVEGELPGVSEDGSWVYLVANGILGETAGEGARPGTCHEDTAGPGATCNLYVLHDGAGGWEAPRLVAVLSGEDWPDWSAGGGTLSELAARVSPDGQWLAFMSERSLTGYDNADANSGQPDEEVFLFDAQADGGAGRVVCASCNPSGARPVGVEYGHSGENMRLVGGAGGCSGNISGWLRMCRAGLLTGRWVRCMIRGSCRIRAACFLIVVMGSCRRTLMAMRMCMSGSLRVWGLVRWRLWGLWWGRVVVLG